jgi:hypothetical protein
MNCGLPELLRSKTPAASTASVRASPGYSETAVTPWRRSPCVMSAVSLSVAAFATPYSTFPMYFWAAQEERFTMSPRRAGTMRRAASWPATSAARHACRHHRVPAWESVARVEGSLFEGHSEFE